jgi:hypothetical protein
MASKRYFENCNYKFPQTTNFSAWFLWLAVTRERLSPELDHQLHRSLFRASTIFISATIGPTAPQQTVHFLTYQLLLRRTFRTDGAQS